MVDVIQERLAEVQGWRLRKGSHVMPIGKADDPMACVIEAVAYVAGEPWSDEPKCVCPVIASMLRRWNDDMRSDDERTRLLAPLIPRLVGSRSTPGVQMRRSFMALDWMVRVMTPAWLDIAGLTEQSALLRELGELHDSASCQVATPAVKAASERASAARAAARAAAWDAAGVKLAPTVEQLQASALDLIDRMLLVGGDNG